jgi:hypothetical protein
VRATARCLRKSRHMILPGDATKARTVAIILPEDRFEALHQLSNVLALLSLFKEAHIVIIGELRVASLFEHIQDAAEILTYDASGRYLFSKELASLANMLSEKEFDVCFLLERTPDVALLHLMARISPRIRIGYDGAGDYPFLNVRVRPLGTRRHISAQNMLMAEALGAKPPQGIRWTVSKDTSEEIAHTLRECRIDEDAVLLGLDAGLFFGLFGEQWTDMLVDKLSGLSGMSLYVFSDATPAEPFLGWLERRGLPTISASAPSRCAALVQRSEAVVSGRAVLFELANLLGKPSIGVFAEDEVGRYCRPSLLCRPVAYSGRPDEQTVAEVCRQIFSLAATGPASR